MQRHLVNCFFVVAAFASVQALNCTSGLESRFEVFGDADTSLMQCSDNQVCSRFEVSARVLFLVSGQCIDSKAQLLCSIVTKQYLRVI